MSAPGGYRFTSPNITQEWGDYIGNLLGRPAWHQHAACRGMGPDLFFPDANDRVAVARAALICDGCPVQVECRDQGAREPRLKDGHGIWGGATTRVIRKKRQMTESVPHGSRATYINYGCRCDACTEATNAYNRDYAARRRSAA